jgi:hypothetical protein
VGGLDGQAVGDGSVEPGGVGDGQRPWVRALRRGLVAELADGASRTVAERARVRPSLLNRGHRCRRCWNRDRASGIRQGRGWLCTRTAEIKGYERIGPHSLVVRPSCGDPDTPIRGGRHGCRQPTAVG